MDGVVGVYKNVFMPKYSENTFFAYLTLLHHLFSQSALSEKKVQKLSLGL